MEELWKSVLAEIELGVSKPNFLMFFKGTNLESLEGDVVTISAPSIMVVDYIEKRYYGLIKQVIDKKTGSNVSLVFMTSKHPKKLADSGSVGPLFPETSTIRKARPSRIRKDYTFESFAVSETNQLAYTAAQTVASNLGDRYNPVFLYGTVGVGKTHLMHAIANLVYEKNNDVQVLYLTTEEFTNEVVESIKGKMTTQMRKKFRNVNLLLLDDIQFLSGKEKVQEELFHTFNSLIEKGGQIVFTSDRPPSEIQKIEARLASRFEGGLTVDIEPPDFELRTAILLMKSEKHDIDFTIDMAKQVAERLTDTRSLEGFLLKLSSLMTSHPDKQISQQAILRLLGKKAQIQQVLKPDQIIETICDFYGIKTTQLKGKKRDSYLVRPRHVCMYLLKEEGKLTFMDIGNVLGGRDHTTVMHAVNKIEKMLQDSENTQDEIGTIKQKMREEYLQ
ncbi:MAG TPA: chromosomal replication initiator protein DnaA [Candidatus Levybacteria bacterium]|nr:chromosomal replication initiator protein DnaA [Candidatus Levybacteria bacterium]